MFSNVIQVFKMHARLKIFLGKVNEKSTQSIGYSKYMQHSYLKETGCIKYRNHSDTKIPHQLSQTSPITSTSHSPSNLFKKNLKNRSLKVNNDYLYHK